MTLLSAQRTQDRGDNFSLTLILSLALVMFMTTACGNRRMPPGGPKDETPPEVVFVSPSPQTENVSLQEPIVIIFSEIVDKPSAQKLAHLTPFTRLDMDWDGMSLILKPATDFSPNTIYDVHLLGTLLDRDNNKTEVRQHQVFMTGNPLSTGRVQGFVSHLRADLSLVRLELLPIDSTRPDSLPPRPSRAAVAERNGAFAIDNLPDGGYRLRAFVDQNKDWKHQATTEPSALSSLLIITEVRNSISDLRLNLKLPGDPGAIAGTITRPDSLKQYKTFLRAIRTADPPDTTQTTLGLKADYVWQNVPVGAYQLAAYIDRDRNSRFTTDLDWFSAYPDTVMVNEGEMTRNVDFNFK